MNLVLNELRDLADILNVGGTRACSPHIQTRKWEEFSDVRVSDVMNQNKAKAIRLQT